jgi:hypothetical protein
MFGRARFGYRNVRTGLLAILVIMTPLYGFVGASNIADAQTAVRFALGSTVATISATQLRDQPAASGAVVLELPVNAQATVAGGPFNDGWYWLDFEGNIGYVQATALVAVDANYTPVPESTPTTPPATATPTPGGAPLPSATGTTTSTTFTPPGVTIPSTPGDYTDLWLAELSTAGNVRVGPGFNQNILKGWWVGRRVLLYQAVPDGKGQGWYRVSETPEQPMWVHSSLVRPIAPVKFEGAKYPGKWVNVNLTQQIVTGYQDGTPVMVTLASTGTFPGKIDPTTGKLEDNRTNVGVWKIYYRLSSQEMKGGNKAAGDYYDLPNVPWVQYFYSSGEALHGTYWHDDFGRPHSHGCVNLSTPIAEWFYNWDTLGTIVWVHY